DHRKLRIFDDNTSGSTKKGVIIQGLEELPVHNAMDAIGLLQKGSERRRVAATKCNDKSSRSHAIFSITVHTKEATPEGEDLIKVGKLNLVDLAGSENIGRSGAENRRAREAGLINQSLLTLGRVINLLVEGVAYIPYRDSKLTRLLQDSLGGHTKTCIIATVAPTRMDMEETLSTLDYANRAKSIKNQPQVNQRMTKKALIKEYAAEVERLKRELLATREKNGIFLPPESYQQLLSESQNHKDSAHEIRAQLEKAEATLEASTARYTQCTELLERTTAKLHQTEQTLQETDEKLGTTTEHLEQARVSLNEQLALAEAYADGESHVDGV
ncbi:Kinesin- motor protein, partial [Dispira parvispora]